MLAVLGPGVTRSEIKGYRLRSDTQRAVTVMGPNDIKGGCEKTKQTNKQVKHFKIVTDTFRNFQWGVRELAKRAVKILHLLYSCYIN